MMINLDATPEELRAVLTSRLLQKIKVDQHGNGLDREIRQLEERLCQVTGGHDFRPTETINHHSGQTLMRCRKCDKLEYQ